MAPGKGGTLETDRRREGSLRAPAGSGAPRRSCDRRTACASRKRNPLLRPLPNRINRAFERASFVGQLVLNPYWRLGQHTTREHSRFFELAEALGQHPVADIGNKAAYLVIASRPVQQDADDRASPATPQQLNRQVVSRAQRVGRPARHAFSLTPINILDVLNLLLYSYRCLITMPVRLGRQG